MPDDSHAAPVPKEASQDRGDGFATRMAHGSRPGLRSHGFVNPPVHRGSTVLYPSCEARREVNTHALEQVMTYGTAGGPTQYALEDLVAGIEGGTRCMVVNNGLAACAVPLLAFLKAGDHCLLPDSVYFPTRRLADNLLRGWGIEVGYYDPLLDESGLGAAMRPNTKVVFTESPGSHTFEVQDVPAIARAAHAAGALVILDNTWGIHHFQPFEHGVDISVQALTKYVAGHSDLVLGAVTVRDESLWPRLRGACLTLGYSAAPDDCWLALRGARTLPVRLRTQAASALRVAEWLETRPEVLRVLHPALPSHPGHALWKRDFTGACSLFGVVLRPGPTEAEVNAAIDGLRLFGIGASWGGYESLVLPTTGFLVRTVPGRELGGPAFRLQIGLEETEDLIADLAAALDRLPRSREG